MGPGTVTLAGLLWAGLRIRIHFIRIRIQSRSRALMTKNWKKITAEKKFNFFESKTTIYLSLGLHKECRRYWRSLQLWKEAKSNISKHEIFNFFSTFVGHFCPPGSGPGSGFRIWIHWPDWIRIRNPASGNAIIVQRDTFRLHSVHYALVKKFF